MEEKKFQSAHIWPSQNLDLNQPKPRQTSFERNKKKVGRKTIQTIDELKTDVSDLCITMNHVVDL